MPTTLTETQNLNSLNNLEVHLSQAPRRKPSLMEAFFTEVNYSSFAQGHELTTSLKPQKNGSGAELVARVRR